MFTSRPPRTLCALLAVVVVVIQCGQVPPAEADGGERAAPASATFEQYDFIAERPPESYSATTPARAAVGQYGDVAYHNNILDPECCLTIAHAGGSYNGKAYTNSLEALDRNYELGRRVFELDFLLSTDGYIVLLHHWDQEGNTRLSREAFFSRGRKYTQLDFEALARWLLDHRDARVITDTKDDFDQFIERVEQRLPKWFIEEHFVFQTYDFDQLERVERSHPGMPVILTIYKLEVSDEELGQRLAGRTAGFALTIPLERALESLPRQREALPAVPIYVHGRPAQINAPQLHSYLQELGATGFYVE